ncbi:MAG: isopeptide-forming domain-containing fimbrial protein [Eubacterium sp.]|nr:isopeptide-forming domain-containing fimbrial protein [Eubacterium sp.]
MKRSLGKRIIMAVVLSVIMVLSIGASVFAEAEIQTNSINIKNGKETSEYSVYQIMTAKAAGQDKDGKTTYEYSVTDSFKGFFNGNPYSLTGDNEIKNANETIVDSDGEWLNTNTTEAAKLAAALEKYAIANNISATTKITGTSAQNLPQGYYVLAETKSGEVTPDDNGIVAIATKPILVNLTEDKEITLKDSTTKLDKVIVEDTQEKKSNNVNIGDTINYKITTSIPAYEANVDKTSLYFVLTDTFSTGLTYNNDLKIEGFTAETDYTAEVNGQVLTITFTKDAIFENQGEPVVATYSAKLNENANVDSTDGNPNDVTLEYTHNTNEDNGHKTLQDETITYTYGFNLHKVDKVAPSEGLADAKFELKDKDGNVVKFSYDDETKTYTVDENGTTTEIVSAGGKEIKNGTDLATVKGLDEGTYTLTETQAPDKYTKLESSVTVTIDDKKDQDGNNTGVAKMTVGGAGNAGCDVIDDLGKKTGSVESDGNTININVYVENAKGISLPETGRNTALYCMIGGVVLVIAGALYYILGARKKVSR